MLVNGYMPSIAGPRPSTSPAPGAVGFLDAAARGGKTAAVQSKSFLATQQAARGALRPLPPTKSSSFSMFIEGSRTGEEKVVSTVERREAAVPTPPIQPPPRAPPTPDAEKDKERSQRERIRKLEAELARAQEQLKRRKEENAELQATNLRLVATAEQAQRRLEDQLQSERADTATLRGSLAEQQTTINELRKEVASLKADLQTRNDQGALEKTAQIAKRDETEALLRATIAALQDKVKATSDANQALMTEAAQLKTRVTELERENGALKTMMATDLGAARDRESALMKQVAALRAQLVDADEQVTAWKKRVTDCNEYVVKVCQPQFSVVKDESLAPLNSSKPNPGEGFVLVPLSLLLEGYGLLPPDVKRRIATTYEQQAQQRKQASSLLSQA